MSSVYFTGVDRIEQLCIDNDVTRWHVAHGWVWNVVDAGGSPLGVLYATLLCGSGAVLHFDTICVIRPGVILAAMRKGVRMVVSSCDVVYATIPAKKHKLISVVERLGFGIIAGGGYESDGAEIVLLKYIENQNTRL